MSLLSRWFSALLPRSEHVDQDSVSPLRPVVAFTVSEAGHAHGNEDALEVREHPAAAGTWLCALADGQGGRAGGATASHLAVTSALNAAFEYSPAQLLKQNLWTDIIRAADEKVCNCNDAGYTTLICLGVAGAEIRGASCGDSAAVLYDGQNIVWLTDRQRKNPPVGSRGAVPVAFAARLYPGWKLLVMSDGVWKYAGIDEVEQALMQYHNLEIINRLKYQVLSAHHERLPDDFSAVLLTEGTLE
jgi:serine/threonine protein phosphatase PrpC